MATCDLDRAIVEVSTPVRGPVRTRPRDGRSRRRDRRRGERAKPGDRVVVSFQISVRRVSRCLRGLTESCKRGGMYGVGAAGGGFGGAQSERVAVPFAIDAMLVPCRRRSRAGDGGERAGQHLRRLALIVPPLRDRRADRAHPRWAGRATASPCTRCRSRRRAGPSRSRSSPQRGHGRQGRAPRRGGGARRRVPREPWPPRRRAGARQRARGPRDRAELAARRRPLHVVVDALRRRGRDPDLPDVPDRRHVLDRPRPEPSSCSSPCSS